MTVNDLLDCAQQPGFLPFGTSRTMAHELLYGAQFSGVLWVTSAIGHTAIVLIHGRPHFPSGVFTKSPPFFFLFFRRLSKTPRPSNFPEHMPQKA